MHEANANMVVFRTITSFWPSTALVFYIKRLNVAPNVFAIIDGSDGKS